MSQKTQRLGKSEEQQLKKVLQARVKDVMVEYFKEKKRVTIKDRELRKFVNTTIRFEDMHLENNILTAIISAKAEDTIKVVVGGGIGIIGRWLGVTVGVAIGIPAGALMGAVAGTSRSAGIGAAFGFPLEKKNCTAEEIFPLLATDGYEERGSDGRVKCTVKIHFK